MSIPVVDIAADDVRKILRLEEGHFHDLKAIEVKPAKLTTLISAYANADGGEVFIGVDEDKSTGIRSWRGFPSQEAANPHLQVFEELFSLGQDFDYEFLRPLSGQLGLVLHVSIRKTREIVTASDGTPYVRSRAPAKSRFVPIVRWPHAWPGATRPRWSRPGARLQRQACSDIRCRSRLCWGPALRREVRCLIEVRRAEFSGSHSAQRQRRQLTAPCLEPAVTSSFHPPKAAKTSPFSRSGTLK
jgi:hypothetical protein